MPLPFHYFFPSIKPVRCGTISPCRSHSTTSFPNQAGPMRNDSPILPLNCADPTRNIPPTSYASSPAPLRTPSYDHPQKVYTSRAKCIYLSNDMYISFKGKVYRFREGVREGGERGMGAAERRIGQDKRGEWNGTERGMAAVICRCSI